MSESRAARTRAGAAVLLAVAGGVLVAVTDYATGAEVDVSLGYVLPVSWAAWRGSRNSGLAVAAFCCALSVLVDLRLGRYRAVPLHLLWNGSVVLGFFGFVVLAVGRIRTGFLVERELHDRLDEQLRGVGRIQRSLLPRVPPAIPGYGIAVHFQTCERAGGDYYDFFRAADGRIGILVADVSGHGATAAVIMAMVRALVHAAPEALSSPDGLLAVTNRRLVEDILENQFATACYALLEPATGRFEWALAGHPPPIRSGPGSAPAELGGDPGRPLGIDAGARYRTASTILRPGDRVVLYTDGLTETRDASGALLGEEAIHAVLAATPPGDPEAALRGMVERAEAHRGAGPVADDITIVVLERSAA